MAVFLLASLEEPRRRELKKQTGLLHQVDHDPLAPWTEVTTGKGNKVSSVSLSLLPKASQPFFPLVSLIWSMSSSPRYFIFFQAPKGQVRPKGVPFFHVQRSLSFFLIGGMDWLRFEPQFLLKLPFA